MVGKPGFIPAPCLAAYILGKRRRSKMDSRVDKLIERIEDLEADAQGQMEKTDKLMSLVLKLIEDKLKERKDEG
jgi:hypothetical protein|tara:strand:- start:232 stop:453 length:222 start_codon:yes stop_codon:yes gene_type:complete